MENLFLPVLSIPAVESAASIHLLYKHFLAKAIQKSLNIFYYACSYAKIDCSRFMNVTARLALQLIPEHLQASDSGLNILAHVPPFGAKKTHDFTVPYAFTLLF